MVDEDIICILYVWGLSDKLSFLCTQISFRFRGGLYNICKASMLVFSFYGGRLVLMSVTHCVFV